MGYLASMLGYGRIQIFLDSHPEKSGFRASGLEYGHPGETDGFPDMTMVISRKPMVSAT
jgi:hypothetical protein